jgi:hypothetical protein
MRLRKLADESIHTHAHAIESRESREGGGQGGQGARKTSSELKIQRVA